MCGKKDRMKSTIGFVLALIGGIGAIVNGISSLGQSVIRYIRPDLFSQLNLGIVDLETSKFFLFTGIIGFVWFAIMGALAIYGSAKMIDKNNESVKQGGILALVAGILSLNFLIIIGGAIGIAQAGKKSK